MTLRRVAVRATGAAGALATLLTAGGGLVYAGQLLPAPARDRTLDVTATLTPAGTVLLPPDRRACLERFALRLQDDAFVVYSGPVVAGSCADPAADVVVERTVESTAGDPPTGVELAARFDEYVFTADPADIGVPFVDVAVPLHDGLGTAPAWLVEGEGAGRDDWVVVVHGRSATRAEALRLLPALAGTGRSILVITYRNDMAGGPSTADGVGRFGRAEAADLTAAVEEARRRGARRVVLLGYSQGASLIAYHLRQQGEAGIDGVVLDSPLLSLTETLRLQARRRSIPGPLVPPVLWGTRAVARLRADVDVADVEHVDALAATTVPMLLIHGTDDDFVPVGPTDRLAAARPAALTYERIPGAGHVEGWNADARRYTEAVLGFLADVLG